MRVLGLDLGTKTIGTALSDDTGTLATPGDVIRRGPGRRGDLRTVSALAKGHSVRAIVIGLPLESDGAEGAPAAAVHEFVRALRGYVRIPIHLVDERCTTVDAAARIAEAGHRSTDAPSIDACAAAVILQDWLNLKRPL